MRLDQVQLAIRPRTAFECLDISFLFCRYHFVGLTLSSAITVVPIAIVNSWLFSLPEMNGYLAYLLLSLEIPWAMMLVTIYLGQITFSRKLSLRRMFADAAAAIPAMVLFQMVVRGCCLAVVVLVPVAFVAMYYMNEIILLEKPPLMKAWDRRTAINSRSLGRMLMLRLLDLGVLCGGTLALSSLFHAISALWEDRSPWLPILSDETDSIDLDTLGLGFEWNWQTQAAFWCIIVFLTVFRFVSYLDCRIRREGWDVELKLRAQAAQYRQKEPAT